MSKVDVEGARLVSLLRLSQSPASMERYRLFGYSSAAVLLVIVVQLLQVPSLSLSLHVALVAAAVGMPLFIMQAYVLEIYLSLGEASYAHAIFNLYRPLSITIQVTAVFALLISLMAVLHHLLPLAAYVFVACSLLAILVAAFLQQSIGRWWFSDWGPKHKYRSVSGASVALIKDWIASGKIK